MFEETGRSVRLLSFKDDQPNELVGILIPQNVRSRQKQSPLFVRGTVAVTKIVMPVVAVALLAFVAISGYGLVGARQQVASPTVTILSPETGNQVALEYGPHAAFSQPAFVDQTREALIGEGVSFIEINFEEKLVRAFTDGVLAASLPVEAFGQDGSWWDAPSGLYKVEDVSERDFSSLAQVYFPWTITFEGNYAIHGTPEYPDGAVVKDDFVGGGVRLNVDDAKRLYEMTKVGMPVLVYKQQSEKDHFVYQASVTGVTAPHYLIADIETGTIIAASDVAAVVPIASVTKLMTAVVASEKLDLDSRVQVTSPTFVESLIPRLQDRTSVSVYSLLQLLLVESSNEAAEVIAGEYGREAFVEEMNSKATQIGMFQSNFVDPSGLGNGNTSTLGDLLRLTQHIHTSRSFIFEITAHENLEGVRDTGEFSDLSNFNEVDDLNNFIGGKVGETTAAGKTSISLHTVSIQGKERTVAIILLGAETRDKDVQTLMKFVEEQYRR